MQTIYVDVLIVLNIYVNFFLLRITAAITHSPLTTKRCILSSAYGSIFSLLILFPALNGIIITLIKMAAAVTIVMIAFGIHGKRLIFINTAAFFTANFILAGTVYAAYSWFSPQFMHMENSYFYIDFSMVILIAVTAGLYFIVYIFKRFFVKDQAVSGDYRVSIRYKDRSVEICGLADTGNILTDLFTGAPVIVCDQENFPETDISADKLPKGFWLLPCKTVSGSGVMAVFRPDQVMIINSISGEKKPVDAVIGLGESNGKAIFNPSILY